MILEIIHNIFRALFFDSKTRKRTWKKLSTQIRYDVPLLLSIEKLEEQAKRRRSYFLANMFENVLENLQSAKNLDVAFAGYAPFDELMLIESGKGAGKLAESFELAAKVVEAKQRIFQSVIGAIAYPCLLLAMLFALFFVIAYLVIPNFALISDPTTWTGAGYALYTFSKFLTSIYGIILIFFIFLFSGVIILSFPVFTGKLRVVLDKFPPYSFYRLTTGAVWLFTFSTLMKAGKQQIDILRNMSEAETSSIYLKERVHAILIGLESGEKFGDALFNSGMNFPDEELVDDLKIYAELPGFDEKLYAISEEWLDEGIEKIKESSKIFNSVCLIFIAFLIVSIALAFQNIQQTLTTGVY